MHEQVMHSIQIIKCNQRVHVIKIGVETSYTCYNKNALANITRYHLGKQLLHTSSGNKSITRENNPDFKDGFFLEATHIHKHLLTEV